MLWDQLRGEADLLGGNWDELVRQILFSMAATLATIMIMVGMYALVMVPRGQRPGVAAGDPDGQSGQSGRSTAPAGAGPVITVVPVAALLGMALIVMETIEGRHGDDRQPAPGDAVTAFARDAFAARAGRRDRSPRDAVERP